MPDYRCDVTGYRSYSLLVFNRKGRMIAGGSYPDIAALIAGSRLVAAGRDVAEYICVGWNPDGTGDEITHRVQSHAAAIERQAEADWAAACERDRADGRYAGAA